MLNNNDEFIPIILKKFIIISKRAIAMRLKMSMLCIKIDKKTK